MDDGARSSGKWARKFTNTNAPDTSEDNIPLQNERNLFKAVILQALSDATDTLDKFKPVPVDEWIPGRRLRLARRGKKESENAESAAYYSYKYDMRSKRRRALVDVDSARNWLTVKSKDLEFVCVHAGWRADFIVDGARRLAHLGWPRPRDIETFCEAG